MSDAKKSVLPIMLATVIITSIIAVGATLYIVNEINEKADTDPGDKVTIEQTSYGAYATYNMVAECDGIITASDGSTFYIDGKEYNSYTFVKGTYTLTFLGGATPKVQTNDEKSEAVA